MKSVPILIPVLVLLIAGCSGEPIQVEEDEVIGEINQNQLTVLNSSDQSIYYAIFDQSIMAYILWAPVSTEENKISGFSKNTFQLTDIFAGDRTTGTIVFYFWVEKNPENGANIKSVTFEVSE